MNKCTLGLNKKADECLNRLLWDICPKSTLVEKETVALAYLAAVKFNDGDISILKILTELDRTPGLFLGSAIRTGSSFKLGRARMK